MIRIQSLAVMAIIAVAVQAVAGPPVDLARKIDQHVNARLKRDGIAPAPRTDDAEFLRRAYLDLAGRIPLISEIHGFLNDAAPDKRAKLVNRLLASPGYVNHFTDVWRSVMLPEATTQFEVAYAQIGFDTWLRDKLKENAGWDKMARELVAAPIGNNRNGNNYYDVYSGRSNPTAFYQAKEGKPENMAAGISRVFLGIHIECAQCHDHPFARWSREQFWSTAAFFAGVERTQPNFYAPLREVLDRRELGIPNTDKVVQAAFLDDKEPRWKFQSSARTTFADWMTSPDNPFFARTAVNRIWAQMFGVGIVDPVDDFNEENKPSHPELLDELAREFIAADYDVKFLIRAIMATETYQRTSRQTDPTQSDARLYSRMPVKALTAEQLYDSLSTAVAFRDQFPRNQPAVVFGNNTPRAEFLSRFGGSNKPTENQTSILQALMLMNGSFVGNATSVDKSETLAAVADSPFLSPARKVESLYLAALARKPRADESAKLVKYLETGDPAKQKQRLGDILWTLLNSVEFRVNH